MPEAEWQTRKSRIEKDMSGDARELFARWIPDGDLGQWTGQLATALREDFAATMKLLRNPDFQKLLLDVRHIRSGNAGRIFDTPPERTPSDGVFPGS